MPERGYRSGGERYVQEQHSRGENPSGGDLCYYVAASDLCVLISSFLSRSNLTLCTDAYIIVSNYVDQLDEEESVKETRQMIQAVTQPAPVTTYASFTVPPQGPAAYAFTQAGQSHGARGNNSNMV